jgi:hypothetical protein
VLEPVDDVVLLAGVADTAVLAGASLPPPPPPQAAMESPSVAAMIHAIWRIVFPRYFYWLLI